MTDDNKVTATAVHAYICANASKTATEIATHFGVGRADVVSILYAMRNKGAASTYHDKGIVRWSGVAGVQWNGTPADDAPITVEQLDAVYDAIPKFGTASVQQLHDAVPGLSAGHMKRLLRQLKDGEHVSVVFRAGVTQVSRRDGQSIAKTIREFARSQRMPDGDEANFTSADVAAHFASIGAPEINIARVSMTLNNLVKQGDVLKVQKASKIGKQNTYRARPQFVPNFVPPAALIEDFEEMNKPRGLAMFFGAVAGLVIACLTLAVCVADPAVTPSSTPVAVAPSPEVEIDYANVVISEGE